MLPPDPIVGSDRERKLHVETFTVVAGRVGSAPDDETPRGPGLSYGLGVTIIRDTATDCVTDLDHAGAEVGYRSDLYAFPTMGATMVVLGNGNGYDADSNAVARSLFPVLGDSAIAVPTEPCADTPAPPPTVPLAVPPAVPPAVTPVTATPRFAG